MGYSDARRGFPWTATENAIFRHLVASGVSIERAAIQMRRSVASMKAHVAALGLSFVRRHNRIWTEHDDAELARYAAEGLYARTIAKRLTRSSAAVWARARYLGIKIVHLPQALVFRLTWTLEDDNALRAMAAAGATCRETANKLGRKHNSVKQRANRMGVKFARAPRPNSWKPEDDKQLRLGIAAGETRKTIGDRIGRSADSVSVRAAILGLKITPMHRGSWTIARLEQAKAWWKEDKSGAWIANELGEGLTRSAVIGKMHRLKCKRPSAQGERRIPRRPAKAKVPKQPKPPKPPKPPCMPGKISVMLASRFYAKKGPRKTCHVEARHGDVARVTHQELERKHCRWPVGDPDELVARHQKFFCGAPRYEDFPYCFEHCMRAYTPRRRHLPPPTYFVKGGPRHH